MKNLSSAISAAFVALLLFSAVVYSSCHKNDIDSCNSAVCYNGGVCKDGVCICAAGYEGPHCSLPVDICKTNPCLNGGWCAKNKCNCPDGFTGERCEIDK